MNPASCVYGMVDFEKIRRKSEDLSLQLVTGRSLVLRRRKDRYVSIVLVKDEIQVALLGFFLFDKYLFKSVGPNVVGVEGHIGVLEVLDEP